MRKRVNYSPRRPLRAAPLGASTSSAFRFDARFASRPRWRTTSCRERKRCASGGGEKKYVSVPPDDEPPRRVSVRAVQPVSYTHLTLPTNREV